MVRHSTDIKRLKKQAASATGSNFELPGSDVVAVTNATILTMEDRHSNGSDAIHDGGLISKGGVIDWVGHSGSMIIPNGATVIDAQGGLLYLAA